MKELLLVAPHFPPSSLVCAHRCRLLATHLPRFGWQPTVLSVRPDRYEEPLAWELERLVPSSVAVIRTRALPTSPLRLIGDLGLRAFVWHALALHRLLRDGRFDLVLFSIPPNYTAVLGPLVCRLRRTPYAVDFMDPWVLPTSPRFRVLTKAWLASRAAAWLEPAVVRHASLITGVADTYFEGALARNARRGGVPQAVGAMGAEPSDFRYLDEHPRPPTLFDPADGDVHIIYAGAMLPNAQESLEAVLGALRELRGDDAARVRLHFVGTGSDPRNPMSYSVRPRAERWGLNGTVREHPARIPYLDVLSHLRSAHAILVLGSTDPHYTPSKLFEAVLARRPVIALLHRQSPSIPMARQLGVQSVISFDSARPVAACVPEIAAAFRAVAARPHDNHTGPDSKAFAPYTAESMVGRLAAAFDRVVDSSGSKTA